MAQERAFRESSQRELTERAQRESSQREDTERVHRGSSKRALRKTLRRALRRASKQASRQAGKHACNEAGKHLECIQSEPCPRGACYFFDLKPLILELRMIVLRQMSMVIVCQQDSRLVME